MKKSKSNMQLTDGSDRIFVGGKGIFAGDDAIVEF